MKTTIVLKLRSGPDVVEFDSDVGVQSAKDVLTADNGFFTVEETSNFMLVKPSDNFFKLIDLYGDIAESERDEHFKALVIKKMTTAGYIIAVPVEQPISDPRGINQTFGAFHLKSTHLDTGEVVYEITSNGQVFLSVKIGNQEEARSVATMMDDHITALGAFHHLLLNVAHHFPSVVAHEDQDYIDPPHGTAVTDSPVPEVARQADPAIGKNDDYLTKLVSEAEAPASEVKQEGSLGHMMRQLKEKAEAKPAPVKIDRPVEESVKPGVNRAVLLVARRGEPNSIEVVFTGRDVAFLQDIGFLNYIKEQAGDMADVVHIPTDDRHMLLLDTELAKNYLLVLKGALQDLNLTIDVDRRANEPEPRRADTIYL